MKKYKSLLILLSFIIAISFCGTTISASSIDEVSEDFVSEDLAKIAAVDFMSSIIKLDSSTNWDSNSRIVETQEIYDLDNNVVSYCFKISNAEDQNEGYVMISANKNEFPILEYSFENEPFYDIAIEEISSQIPGIMQETQANDRTISNPKIYLSDNYNYLAELQIDGIKRTFDITTNNFNEVNKMDYQSKDISYSEDNNQIWDKIVENFNNNMYSSSISRTSNPPDKYNTFITNPGSYESGWQTGYTFNCARYDQTYYTLSQFDGGGVCAPTAATNLCYYYYKLDYFNIKT